MKKILITGANSYIGTSLDKWFQQRKFEGQYYVDTLDLKKPDWKLYNFSQYDVVFHVAGIAHVDTGKISQTNKSLYYKVNTELAIETAKKAKAEGVQQFIYMSSLMIYGANHETEGRQAITRDTKPKPTNCYGDSKLQADLGIQALSNASFHTVSLRSPMVYGNGSKGNYPLLAKLAKKLPVFPKVYNKRSMIYIENLCESIRYIIDQKFSGIYFPQNAELVSTSEMVKLIAKTNHHRIWITRLLTPFAILGKYMPGRIGALCRKAFGNSYYAFHMEDSIALVDFEESIRRTEA